MNLRRITLMALLAVFAFVLGAATVYQFGPTRTAPRSGATSSAASATKTSPQEEAQNYRQQLEQKKSKSYLGFRLQNSWDDGRYDLDSQDGVVGVEVNSDGTVKSGFAYQVTNGHTDKHILVTCMLPDATYATPNNLHMLSISVRESSHKTTASEDAGCEHDKV